MRVCAPDGCWIDSYLFYADHVLQSHESTGRALLQAKKSKSFPLSPNAFAPFDFAALERFLTPGSRITSFV